MLVYWTLFLVPALVALSAKPLQNVRSDGARKISIDPIWFLVVLTLIVLIGFRDRVGGDWFNYFHYLFRAEYMTFSEALQRSDPAYEILNILSLQLGLGVVGVNIFCGTVFATGLVVYVRSMPRPWLALAVAIPYMTVVVSMGYARQGVALGFALIGLVALSRERFIWFAFWVMLAATFHRSAVLLIGIALLNLDFRKIWNLPILLGIAFVMYVAFLEDNTDNLVEQYITNQMQSDGAFVRLLMNVIPAILFVIHRKKFDISRGERKTYFIISIFAVVSFFGLLAGVLPSTAIDRMALYIIPLQVFVFANLPDALGGSNSRKTNITFLILLFYALALFVWLNFANFSHWWLPYRMFPPLDVYEAEQMLR